MRPVRIFLTCCELTSPSVRSPHTSLHSFALSSVPTSSRSFIITGAALFHSRHARDDLVPSLLILPSVICLALLLSFRRLSSTTPWNSGTRTAPLFWKEAWHGKTRENKSGSNFNKLQTVRLTSPLTDGLILLEFDAMIRQMQIQKCVPNK